jgi:hypothetical protein
MQQFQLVHSLASCRQRSADERRGIVDLPGHIAIALEYERLFRSRVIANAADAEASVDRIIAWHFCPDQAKHDLFYATLFRESALGLRKKLLIVRRILKAEHADLVKPAAFWIRGLDRLGNLRNKLAHGRMEYPKEAPPPEEVAGVSVWWPKPTGELALELISRAKVDEQVRQAQHLIMAGVCLARIVEDRAQQSCDAERDAGLLRMVAACEASIREHAAA